MKGIEVENKKLKSQVKTIDKAMSTAMKNVEITKENPNRNCLRNHFVNNWIPPMMLFGFLVHVGVGGHVLRIG